MAAAPVSVQALQPPSGTMESPSCFREHTNSVFFPRGSRVLLEDAATTGQRFELSGPGAVCVEADALVLANGSSELRVPAAEVIGATCAGTQVTLAWAPLDLDHVAKRHEHDTIKRALRTRVVSVENPATAQRMVDCVRVLATPSPEPRTRRIFVIVNPHGGRRSSSALYKKVIAPMLEFAGLEAHVVVTDHAGHAKELGEAFDPAAFEGVITVSGDGTVNEFTSGLLTRPKWHELIRRTAICTIKAGTTNAIAAGIRTNDPTYAIWCVIKRKLRPLDAMLVVNGHDVRTLAVCVFGWGMATGVAADSEPYRYLGIYRYSYLKLRHAILIGKGYERFPATVDISSDVALKDSELADYFTVPEPAAAPEPVSTGEAGAAASEHLTTAARPPLRATGSDKVLRRSFSSIRHFNDTAQASAAAPQSSMATSYGTVLGMTPDQSAKGLVNLRKATAQLLLEYQHQSVQLEEGPPMWLIGSRADSKPIATCPGSNVTYPSFRIGSEQPDALPSSVLPVGTELDREILLPTAGDSTQARVAVADDATAPNDAGAPFEGGAAGTGVLQPRAEEASAHAEPDAANLRPNGGFGALTLCRPGCRTCSTNGRLRYVGNARVLLHEQADLAASEPVTGSYPAGAPMHLEDAHVSGLGGNAASAATASTAVPPTVSKPDTTSRQAAQQSETLEGVQAHTEGRHRFLARLFKRTRRARQGAQLSTTIKEPPLKETSIVRAPHPGMLTKADFPGSNYTHTVSTGVTRRGFFKRREEGQFATVVAINLAAEALYHHASDGYMDLLIVRRGSLGKSLRLALRYFGQIIGLTDIYGPPLHPNMPASAKVHSPLIDYYKARCMIVTPDPEHIHEAANVDGELFPGPGPFKVYTLPSLLTVYGEW